MEFNEFKEYVCRMIGKRLGDEFTMKETPVTKNNGIVLSGLSFVREGATISPTVYIENYYEAYENGLSLECIINEMIDIFSRNDYVFDFDFEDIMDLKKTRSRIRCRLVNYGKNETLLKNCPHIKIFDLCVMFYLLIGSYDGDEGSVTISNGMLEEWGISKEELYDVALKNTKASMGIDITNIRDIMKEMMRKNMWTDEPGNEGLLDELWRDDPAPMYVITNPKRFYGATCLLFTDEIRRFADALGADLFILPSSVHELIAIPDYEEADPNFLYSMVKDINENEVSERDILSTNVYKYCRVNEQMFCVFEG